MQKKREKKHGWANQIFSWDLNFEWIHQSRHPNSRMTGDFLSPHPHRNTNNQSLLTYTLPKPLYPLTTSFFLVLIAIATTKFAPIFTLSILLARASYQHQFLSYLPSPLPISHSSAGYSPQQMSTRTCCFSSAALMGLDLITHSSMNRLTR